MLWHKKLRFSATQPYSLHALPHVQTSEITFLSHFPQLFIGLGIYNFGITMDVFMHLPSPILC